MKIALVGDYNPEELAHQAIDRCFALAARKGVPPVEPVWTPTQDIRPGGFTELRSFAGIWLVPASPYRHMAGAMWCIEYARTQRVPFLGTCGGFQHALLEFVRHALSLEAADHAESSPGTAFPLLHRMSCSLVEKTERVQVVDGNAFAKIYGADSGMEAFHCSYGLNPQYESLLAGTDLQIVARSTDGQARAVQLRRHPFFIGTLFQPERRALEGTLHPIVINFFAACANGYQASGAPLGADR